MNPSVSYTLRIINLLILAGDFNLPHIIWIDGYGTSIANLVYGLEFNSLLLTYIAGYLRNDHCLDQLIHLPTRNNIILVLVFSTQPNLISEICIIPGISDHEVVTFSIRNSLYAYTYISILYSKDYVLIIQS